MTSLFARQFGSRPDYGLGGLPTGVPQVGVNLPKGGGNAPGEAGVRAGVTAGVTATAEAGAAESLAEGQSRSLSQARQGTLSKLNHLAAAGEQENSGTQYAPGSFASPFQAASGASVSTPSPEWGIGQPKVTPQAYINQTATSPHTMPTGVTATQFPGGTSYSAPAPAPRPAPPGGNVFTNWFDNTRHDIASGADRLGGLFTQSQGLPDNYSPHVPGQANYSGANYMGGSSSISQTGHVYDPTVLEPSAVYSPGSAGAVYGNEVMSGQKAKAIGMAPYSSQFKASFGRDVAQYGQGLAAATPTSSEISDFFDNPGRLARTALQDVSNEG